MEITKIEIFAVEEIVEQRENVWPRDLDQLELMMIAGGTGDIILG